MKLEPGIAAQVIRQGGEVVVIVVLAMGLQMLWGAYSPFYGDFSAVGFCEPEGLAAHPRTG